MRIVAPVSSVQEVEMLLHWGADELYCGVSTPEWEEHFGGLWWMNRRSPVKGNLLSWEDIRTVVQLAHAKKIPVSITSNAPFYPSGSMHYLLRLSEKLVSKLDVDGLIVSDINFLLLLFREKIPVGILLSSLGSCFNSRAARFYRSLGVKRIILPRQLRLREIEDLVREANTQIEFEVFALNDGCYFEEGFCQTSHALGPFCLTEGEVAPYKATGNGILSKEIETHLKELREYLWYQNNCGSSFQGNGLPNGPCSLCWFGYFRDWGIQAVKIAGREASFYRKMRSVQLVKAVMDEVRRGISSEEVGLFARSLRQTPEYCDQGYMCYFRNIT